MVTFSLICESKNFAALQTVILGNKPKERAQLNSPCLHIVLLSKEIYWELGEEKDTPQVRKLFYNEFYKNSYLYVLLYK